MGRSAQPYTVKLQESLIISTLNKGHKHSSLLVIYQSHITAENISKTDMMNYQRSSAITVDYS